MFTTEVSDGFAKLNMLLLKAVGSNFPIMSAETLEGHKWHEDHNLGHTLP